MIYAGIRDIMRVLPHRYPFLFLDKVLDCSPGVSIVAIKNVTMGDGCFLGHFPPDNPVFPGVLQLECMAQASAFCYLKSCVDSDLGNSMCYIASIELAKFRKVVVPGDVLVIESSLQWCRHNMAKFSSSIKVSDVLASEAVITAAMR